MSTDRYTSPLSERYASKEMQYIFSQDMKFKTWRKLWIALAETEKELGLPITQEQIDELKAHADDINYDVAKAREKGEDPFLILLDEIEDPHNLGAIIRTANLAGAHGVIIPKNRAAGLTATVARTSAGALNYTPVAKVTNLSSEMEALKEQGMWFVCADMGGTEMYDLDLKGPIGLVIGNEGEGVSRLVREHCDMTASIPMKGDIDSLNASVAAGVLAYASPPPSSVPPHSSHEKRQRS